MSDKPKFRTLGEIVSDPVLDGEDLVCIVEYPGSASNDFSVTTRVSDLEEAGILPQKGEMFTARTYLGAMASSELEPEDFGTLEA